MAKIEINIPDSDYNQFLRRFAKRLNKPDVVDPTRPDDPQPTDSDWFGTQLVKMLQLIDQSQRINDARVENKEAEKAKPLIDIYEVNRGNRP